MLFTLGVLGAIGAGFYALCQVAKLLWSWLKDRIRERKLKNRSRDEGVMELERLRREAELHLSYDDLESIIELEEEGKTHLIFSLDRNGNMTGEVDLIEAEDVDETVAMHLRRGSGMFVA